MVYTTNKYSIITVSNSITNTVADEKYDKNSPFSFIEYLNYTRTLIKTDINFTTYQDYLKVWNEVTSTSYVDYNTQVRIQFINFLKTISLNYTTPEERRFLININYDNVDELEVAIPFFVTKIKDIILYYANKRDTYKLEYNLSLTKGTTIGIENFVRTTILETLFGDDTVPYITLQQPLSTISSNLKIEIEEGYDTFNDYFDLDPSKPPSFYKAVNLRKKYFTSNTNKIDPNLFLNLDQAIIDLINSEGVVLAALQNLVINVDTPTIEYLQPYDFTDYTNVSRENLKLTYNIELIKKFTGTNFYYLSTDTFGNKLSGVLFDSSDPYANLLNLHNPATLTVPEGLTKYDRDVGLFFKPTNRSILNLQTPFSYYAKEQLEPGKLYIFPDPNSYGNVSGVSKVDYETPLNFDLKGLDIQKNISSNIGVGNTLVTNNDFTFESYHSLEQNSKINVINNLYNSGVVTNYVSDIYGNLFVGFKQQTTSYISNFESNTNVVFNGLGLSAISTTPFLSSIKTLTDYSVTNTGSKVASPVIHNNSPTIYKTKYSVGNFYIYNIQNDTFNSFSEEFDDVIQKYQSQKYSLQNQLQNIEIFSSTFVLTTSTWKIIDNVLYNDGFYKSADIPFILSANDDSVFSNVYLVNTDLYLAKYSIIDDDDYNLNTRKFKLRVYRYSISNNSYTECYFDDENDSIYTYEFNTKLYIQNAILCYNEKIDAFSVVVGLKDDNLNLYMQTISFYNNSGKLSIKNTDTYNSSNFNSTINFYDPDTYTDLSLNNIEGTISIDTQNGTLVF